MNEYLTEGEILQDEQSRLEIINLIEGIKEKARLEGVEPVGANSHLVKVDPSNLRHEDFAWWRKLEAGELRLENMGLIHQYLSGFNQVDNPRHEWGQFFTNRASSKMMENALFVEDSRISQKTPS